MGADLGAVLVHAVVVGRDRAGPDVGALTDGRVADVRQVRHFGTTAERRVLRLDERADFAVLADYCAGAQVGERADGCACADHGERAVGAAHASIRADFAVGEGRVGADNGAARDRGRALELGARQDLDVLLEGDGAVDPHARGVADRHARELPAAHDHGVEPLGRVAQLHAVVDTRDEPALAHGQGGDRLPGSPHEADDIGEVLLLLHVVGAHEGERVAQGRNAEHIGARVDLGEGALGVGGIFLLDDAVEGSGRVAHHAAVARGVGEHGAEHGRDRGVIPVLGDESGQCVGVEQRHVARDDEHVACEVCRKGIQRHFGGPPRARNLVLIDDRAVAVALEHGRRDAVALVPHDGHEVGRIESARGGEHVADERDARQAVQHLGGLRLHAGALPGSEHYDGEARVSHGFILSAARMAAQHSTTFTARPPSLVSMYLVDMSSPV